MKSKYIQKPQNNKSIESYHITHNNLSVLVKKDMLGIAVTDARKEDILKYIVNSLKNSSQNYYITTPNPEMIVYAASHPSFKAILNGARVALCDGAGLLWGARIVAKPLKERFSGVELVEKLCENANIQPITVGFFGGRPGVAELASECLRQKYSNLKVVYASDVWDEKHFEANIINSLKDSRDFKAKEEERSVKTTRLDKNSTNTIDILFVALGFPKQEEWMAAHINKVPVRVMVGVGGAFDYLSGRVPRAPKWVQNIGMEWAFRLAVQPWRIKRQLALVKFVWMVMREKMKGK